ncbi:reduction in Cnn dots 7 [Cochliomyia hominivorax]
MAINFEEIPSAIEIPLKPTEPQRSVVEELEARQHLQNERSIKCQDIHPFFERRQKKPLRYTYKYFCVCPRYNPKYTCKHSGNIIIDRDILTSKEHIVYLATPKPNLAAPRKLPQYYLKKSIIANCTARINHLAKPDLRLVNQTLNNFNHILNRRRKHLLNEHLLPSNDVEYTSIQKALEWLNEEHRLKRVAKRKERLRCQKLKRKILKRQRKQIKKIVCVVFEKMKDFLLNDQFVMDEGSALVSVILETLREFSDKHFYITNNLQEYQKILSSNLAVWINKFISNLNIHIEDEPPIQYEAELPQTEKPTQELSSFLPIDDYISQSSGSEEFYYEEEEDEEYYSYQQNRGDKGDVKEQTEI